MSPDKVNVIAWEASDKITLTLCADSDSWQWALTRPGWKHEKLLTRSLQQYVQTLTADGALWVDQGNSMWRLWQDQGDNTCGFCQLTMGCGKTRATVCRASDKITVTTLTTNCEFWQGCAITHVASAKQPIVRMSHTWLHPDVHKHSCYHSESTLLVHQYQVVR